jgi:APA family basic amino acid/polyamine antiporter
MSDKPHIKPQLRLYDLTVIVVGLVIGMGIFRTPVEVANKAGRIDIFFYAWIAGAIVSYIGAFVFAEIGSRYPRAGGFYKIFSHCYHPAFAFMVNWITVISNAASAALVAMLGAEYLAPLLFPEMKASWSISGIALLAVGILYFINLRGIKPSARILSGLMFVKVSLLLIIIGSIFFIDAPNVEVVETTIGSPWNAFAMCFIPVFFTFGGYQQTMNFGGDAGHARKSLPRAILIGMTIVSLIYMASNYAYYHALGFQGLQQTTTLASVIPGILFGDGANKIISLIMFFSVMAYVHVSMMSNPRVYFAMAEEGAMPPILMRLNKKTQVQEYALSFFTFFIVITLIFAESFESALKYVMFFDSIGFMAAAAAIFIFRKRAKEENTASEVFKMRGYPLLPALFILVYAALTVTIFINEPITALIGFALFLIGWPLYHAIRSTLRLKK